MSDDNRSRVPTATSEESADLGRVSVSARGEQCVLSDAAAWLEDGVFVIRSTEFDVMAEDEDFKEALDLFANRIFDYADMLGTLVSDNRATPAERETLADLSSRVIPWMTAVERASNRLHFRLPRLRNTRTGHWQHRATQASGSSRLSVA
ncbi:MAG TPA: hypothetical protein VK730_13715 [Solirubrobacteraceae bacterium]|jgi:hypothetical protein|nr:hypothetical protein [Solirubrobacteraceae bacterium]